MNGMYMDSIGLALLHVLANDHTYQVLNFSNEAVDSVVIHQGSNLYEHPNSEYLFFDYWGVVNNLLVSLLSELKK